MRQTPTSGADLSLLLTLTRSGLLLPSGVALAHFSAGALLVFDAPPKGAGPVRGPLSLELTLLALGVLVASGAALRCGAVRALFARLSALFARSLAVLASLLPSGFRLITSRLSPPLTARLFPTLEGLLKALPGLLGLLCASLLGASCLFRSSLLCAGFVASSNFAHGASRLTCLSGGELMGC